MSLTIGDQYYLKALDWYRWNLEQATESLQYALSYDPDHVQANCLMGRLYMERMKDYWAATHYFDKALAADINYVDTYKYYSLLCIWQGKYDKALKIIDYGMKIRGMDTSVLHYHLSVMASYQKKWKKAIGHLENALILTHNEDQVWQLEQELIRLQKKVKKRKSKKKKKNK